MTENKQPRLLLAEEIDARVKTWDKTSKKWAMILLYKDARVDQKLMDETYGVMNWKRSHELIDGNLYCTVSVWNEKTSQWVSKQDVGTESDTEKEKGQASDSFKRACFNWGIGRELYTAPSIFVNTTEADYDKQGKFKTKLTVATITYNESREIIGLELKDGKGVIRFSTIQSTEKPATKAAPKATAEARIQQYAQILNATPAPSPKTPVTSRDLPKDVDMAEWEYVASKIQEISTKDELKSYFAANVKLKTFQPFRDLCNDRYGKLTA